MKKDRKLMSTWTMAAAAEGENLKIPEVLCVLLAEPV
jgi:hypothetical protein